MQRKGSIKSQIDKITERIQSNLDKVDKLCESTPTPLYSSAPDMNCLKNLSQECSDSAFW